MEHALEEATPMRYRRATAMLALALGMSAFALVVLAGPAYRLHLIALGSAFSLLPAQNATGNWIKVVQRLPVRIELDPKQLADHPLRIGLSTLVTVDTANRDGQILASQVRSTPAYESNARAISLDPVNKLIDDIVKANAG